jgi:hypothetical protein
LRINDGKKVAGREDSAKKNMVEREDSTKSDQPSFHEEFSNW